MQAPIEIERCVILGTVTGKGSLRVRDTVFLRGGVHADQGVPTLVNCVVPSVVARAGCELTRCTVLDTAMLDAGDTRVAECILARLDSLPPAARIERCDILSRRGAIQQRDLGGTCFSKNPQFRDPKSFDYRLKRTSPCRGKASDGGDIGCRYTPEMLEMLKLAFELRKKGIIKF